MTPRPDTSVTAAQAFRVGWPSTRGPFMIRQGFRGVH